LLEMARCIAIQDHDNPVTQHGLASYVTNFESQSFRLRSRFFKKVYLTPLAKKFQKG